MKTESKRDKFVRLAENRMENVLKGIDLLGNLSNSSAYEYEQADLDKIVRTLKTAVNTLEKKYELSTKRDTFKL